MQFYPSPHSVPSWAPHIVNILSRPSKDSTETPHPAALRRGPKGASSFFYKKKPPPFHITWLYLLSKTGLMSKMIICTGRTRAIFTLIRRGNSSSAFPTLGCCQNQLLSFCASSVARLDGLDHFPAANICGLSYCHMQSLEDCAVGLDFISTAHKLQFGTWPDRENNSRSASVVNMWQYIWQTDKQKK